MLSAYFCIRKALVVAMAEESKNERHGNIILPSRIAKVVFPSIAILMIVTKAIIMKKCDGLVRVSQKCLHVVHNKIRFQIDSVQVLF